MSNGRIQGHGYRRPCGAQPLSSERLREVLAYVQQAAIAGRSISVTSIARALRLSSSITLRYMRALRRSGHVTFEDRSFGTVRVKEWL